MTNQVAVQDRQTQTGDDQPLSPPPAAAAAAPAPAPPPPPPPPPSKHAKLKKARRVAAIVGIVAGITGVIVISAVIPGLGFAAGGIVAGSYAASMMSSAAIASGGGVAAGSTVAVLQAIGASGAAGAASAALGSGAGALAVGEVIASASEVYTQRRRSNVKTRSVGTQTD